MKPTDEDEIARRLFDGFRPPPSPPELRERVLLGPQNRAAADSTPDAWTRIWENPWLRLAWAASMLLLLTGNLVLVPHETEAPTVVADVYVDEAIAEFLRPMRIADTATPNLGRSGGGRHELVGIDEGGNAS